VSSPNSSPPFDAEYALEDRYTRETGRVYLTGVQALVRLPMLQHARDAAAGLDTAGFISGYRGSPLGTFDMALWQAKDHLSRNQIHFEPGVNEDLAATAVWGSQQAHLYPKPRYDGVFGMWYGKGPGVDRSCDALKHANYAGTSATGGVLALAGDDPGAKSSSIAHQSEHAFIHCGIPTLNPANVQDYIDLGLYGFALSRYAGCWVGFKCLTDTVESGGAVEVGPERAPIALPEPDTRPEGLHIAFSNIPLQVEARMYQQRLPAALAFARTNRLDRVVFGAGRVHPGSASKRRIGIITTGKATLDVRQALDELGIDEARARAIGLEIYKIALVWPIEPEGLREFCLQLDDVIVIEEKRPLLEEQIARTLYNENYRPRISGKRDVAGAPLVPSEGELSPAILAEVLRTWLAHAAPDVKDLRSAPEPSVAPVPGGGLMRLPAFCSGCPHNTSTVVPAQSLALGGIGCHGMAVWLPDRPTLAVTQMGGEGANWVGAAPFTRTPHMFQNLGDGTYFHSGLLAIRAAVSAGVNITYKILANGAIAMTGGQPIEGAELEGEVTVPEIAAQLHAEGVDRIAIVSNEPDKYPKTAAFPAGTTIHHRDTLDAVQQELRDIPGVTALVYDQTCAAEARRLRKRHEFPDPDRRIVINELVCEGCGDCSVQSNCISIEPVETEFGRKRRINQSSCNKDFSCVKGHCPSFVSVIGGSLRKASGDTAASSDDARLDDLPLPALPALDDPFNVLVTGIGGTGVITVGALIGMAAYLEGKGVSVLDVTGLAQKNGPVTSHVRVAATPEDLHATRIGSGGADVVIGCDIVVSSSPENLGKLAKGRTTPIINRHVAPTSDFASNPDLDLTGASMQAALRAGAGDESCHFVDATRLATALLGDALFTNPFLMGFAFQQGRLPVGLAALEHAMELNGRAVEANKRAFAWGRLAVLDLEAVEEAAKPALRSSQQTQRAEALDEIVDARATFLTDYQDTAYANDYREFVDAITRQTVRVPGSDRFNRAVARYLFKLMARKDEFEVARLYSDGSFRRQLEAEFEGDYRLKIHFAPPSIPLIDWAIDRTQPGQPGRMKKIAFGQWFLRFLGLLAKLRFLRGTRFNPFGETEQARSALSRHDAGARRRTHTREPRHRRRNRGPARGHPGLRRRTRGPSRARGSAREGAARELPPPRRPGELTTTALA
jgi:indolepyruvate ferredoxin oxidoreductase